MAVTRDAVIYAFRLILNRGIESEADIVAHMQFEDEHSIWNALLNSDEFRVNLKAQNPYGTDSEILRAAENIVNTLYRCVLKRDADSYGLELNIQYLLGADILQKIPSLIEVFANSDEVKNRYEVRKYLYQDMNNISNIISLGCHCYTSSLLKSLKLKFFSCPFDWIFSSPKMIQHCIADDFNTFLDKKYYETIPESNRIGGPDANLVNHNYYYENYGIRAVFNHHNVLNEEEYLYFVRCVARFKSLLVSEEVNVFLMCCNDSPSVLNDFIALSDTLSVKGNNCILWMIAISPPSGQLLPQINEMKRHGNNILFDMKPVSQWQPLSFSDAIDDEAIKRLVLQLNLVD